jgi:HSP20 family molecular chaperone IbpA
MPVRYADAPVPSSRLPQAPPPVNPQLNSNPLWGGQDPFVQMQQMQQEIHKRMQQMLPGFDLNDFDSSLFDMDPFQNGGGFGSSMGFGAEPEFDFTEMADSYQVSIAIPDNSKVEITTQVNGRDLTIEGKVTVEQQSQANDGGCSSMQTRQFARTLTLPADVDPLGISNETVHGQVVITIPKQQGSTGPLL